MEKVLLLYLPNNFQLKEGVLWEEIKIQVIIEDKFSEKSKINYI